MATISTHNGSAVKQAHNIRAKSCLAKEKHIDPTRPHEVWRHETVAHAYHRLFDQARNDYNARQTRTDRKLTRSYLSEIWKDEKKHPCYEMIIGVYGNEVQESVGRQIMKEFVDGWQERNPNLELIGAYYHADEEGSPHVHLDYIPVAHGYKRGPETQTGLVKALKEQGFVKKDRDTAQIRWEARENRVLEELCRARGLEVEHPQAGKEQIRHAETRVYKAEQRAKEAERNAERLEAKADRAECRLLQAKDRVRTAENHLSGLYGSIDTAKAQKLDALRERDSARAGRDVAQQLRQATNAVKEVTMGQALILSETPERTSVFGKVLPATVTLSREDYDRIMNLRTQIEQAEQLLGNLAWVNHQMHSSAAEINRNRIDSYEVSVDHRVQRAQENALSAEKHRDRVLQELEAAKSELAILQELKEVIAFYPDEYERMRVQTNRLRELEHEYYDYERMKSPKRLLGEYMRLCDQYDLPADPGMLEAYEQLHNHIHEGPELER